MPRSGHICLISVPHTGTRFTIELFRRCGFEDLGLHEPSRLHRPAIFNGHVLKEGQMAAAEKKAAEMPLIVPLRHPFVVEESWRRRGKSIAEMVECFRRFAQRFWPICAHVLPIDSEWREEALAAMSVALGLPLSTDWAVVNGREGSHDLWWMDCRPSLRVQRLATEMEPILGNWY